MSDTYLNLEPFGTITPKQEKSDRLPYEHQRDAMSALSAIDAEKDSYSGLIVFGAILI